MNLLHKSVKPQMKYILSYLIYDKTEEFISLFENELFLLYSIIRKNSSFSNRDNSSVLWSKFMF
jgi:hypothetical protein